MSRSPTARRNHRIMSPPTLPALRQPHPPFSSPRLPLPTTMPIALLHLARVRT